VLPFRPTNVETTLEKGGEAASGVFRGENSEGKRERGTPAPVFCLRRRKRGGIRGGKWWLDSEIVGDLPGKEGGGRDRDHTKRGVEGEGTSIPFFCGTDDGGTRGGGRMDHFSGKRKRSSGMRDPSSHPLDS